MKDTTVWAVLIIVLGLIVCIAIGADTYQTAEFAKAGLQECPNHIGPSGDVVWQKECK